MSNKKVEMIAKGFKRLEKGEMKEVMIGGLEKMEKEDLKEMKEVIDKLMKEETEKNSTFVVLEGECKDSSTHHLKKYKHWMKKVKAIDVSKSNGFAFNGDFLSVDKQNTVRDTDFVMEVSCGDLLFYKGNDKDNGIKGKMDEMASFIQEADNFMKKNA